MERRDEDDSLWIYVIDKGEKIPIRQVWILHYGGNVEGASLKQKMRDAWVGCYSATPMGDGERAALDVQFSAFELVIKVPRQMQVRI